MTEKKVIYQPPPMMDAKDMVMPRLELRWKKVDGWAVARCNYSLILPIEELDIRNRGRQGKKGARFKRIHIGHTTRTSGSYRPDEELSPIRQHPVRTEPETYPPERVWTVDTPFRDGAHAKWDAERLGLPAYAVCGDKAALLHDGRPEEYKSLPFGDLTTGDRFLHGGATWTKLGPDTARHASREPGHNASAVCSFDPSDKVEFIPA